MAPESCNLGKDEAEILKTSSSSSSSSSSTTTTTTTTTTTSSSPPPSNTAPSSTSSQLSSQQPPPFLPMEPPHQTQRPDEESSDTTIASPIKASSLRKHEEEPHSPVQFSNRCSTCQKRIGLTGFRCRCGDLFCARHRHSDTHDCSFDYKSAGREEISKANPVIRAAKIIKI